MANYRQTNHNGRVNAKTGKAYSRKHNDREYDVTKAENINVGMVAQNIILHYDSNNTAHAIDSRDANRITIDEHEHQLYQELFGVSLAAQHKRNEAARHPERNKTIDDLLEGKNTCPEETIFQIGSVEDGFPDPSVLMEVFEEYQKEVIGRYGDNIHFLDATLHLDEAVPHIHVRKVWTYEGKDGLDISQNKALEAMGFKRPDPDKKPGKWNNAKIPFSEWERDVKISLCQNHGLNIEEKPKTPGKTSMTKEEAIAVKLQEQNKAAQESLDVKKEELARVSAELVTEEMKNKEITDKNIFGMARKITVTPEEYRRWQKSAETKEKNEAFKEEMAKRERTVKLREKELASKENDLRRRESNVDYEIKMKVDKKVQLLLPIRTKQKEEYIESKSRELEEKEKQLDDIAQKQHETEAFLQSKADRLSRRERELDEEIKRSVADVIKDMLKDFFLQFKERFIRFFKGEHQENVISVVREMRIDRNTADRLSQYGFHLMEDHTVGEILDRAETEDIKDALHNAGADYRQIGSSEIEAVKSGIEKGGTIEEIIQSIAEQAAQKVVRRRHR